MNMSYAALQINSPSTLVHPTSHCRSLPALWPVIFTMLLSALRYAPYPEKVGIEPNVITSEL